jgi:hypothetical protein
LPVIACPRLSLFEKNNPLTINKVKSVDTLVYHPFPGYAEKSLVKKKTFEDKLKKFFMPDLSIVKPFPGKRNKWGVYF